MKKLLSILTLLLCFSSGVWADEFVLSQSTATSFVDDKPDDGKAITFLSNGQTFSIAKGSTAGTAGKMGNLLKLSKNATYTITLPTGFTITAINFKGYANNKSGTDVKIDKVNGTDTNWGDFPGNGVASTESSWGNFTFNVTGSAQTASTITFHIADKQQIGVIITITGSVPAAGPTITAQPQGAEYITGYAATAMHVAATASAGTLSYQWYSCDDAEKNNPQPVGDNSASYVPSTTNAGTYYYYCKVTDSNGSTESAVAKIVVAAAAAPTISVSGAPAEPVKVGTEVTLTAEVTGMPTPTIKWFSNTTASTSGGTVITGETGLTYSPSTATAGTYYYYAQAVNTEGDALSAVQTIVVQEKLGVPKVNGERYFLTNVNATINVVDGTTVKYKKNGGAEETYVAKTVISSNEDMELQVWAEKDGFLSSDKVTVNFKKVTDTGVTAVEEVSSWDWSKPAKISVDAVEPDPVKLETLLSEIDAFNYDDFGPALTSIKYINAQRFTVKDDYVQAHGFVIKTSVSGKLDFKVRGTNSNTRYVVVNGENAGKVTSSGSDKNINSIAIPVGTTVVYGLDEASQAANNIRYYNVTFTPAANITDAEWATTVTPDYAVDFADGVKAYIVESVGEAITLKEIEDAPANTPIIVNAASAGSYTMTKKATATSDVNDNKLEAATGAEIGNGAGNFYVLGMTSTGVGFGKLADGVTLAKGKAFIPGSAWTSSKDFLPFVIGDEESETTSIKAVETAEVSGTVYNLAGQKVGKDYKGIVIVNGKKFVRK